MANPWTIFEDLIAKDKRIICKVVSTNATTGRISVIQVGYTTAIYVESNGSSYANDSFVFVEGNVIVGQAPTIRSSYTELLT